MAAQTERAGSRAGREAYQLSRTCPRNIHTTVEFRPQCRDRGPSGVSSPPKNCSRSRRDVAEGDWRTHEARLSSFPRPDVRNEGNPNGPCPAHHDLLRTLAQATAACCAFAQVRLPSCFKASTSTPAPSQLERRENAPLIDEDLPLHNFKSISLFMRRRSAWLCVSGAVLAYFAFLPPLLVVVPLMTEQFCTEWHAGTGVEVVTLQSTGAIAPEFMARWNQSPSGRAAHDGRLEERRRCRTAATNAAQQRPTSLASPRFPPADDVCPSGARPSPPS